MAKILIVDDEDIVREYLAKLLNLYGHNVHSASGGKSALHIFEKDPGSFDLVLTDLNMPEGDGIMLSMGVKEISAARTGKAVSVLMLTASGLSVEERARMLKLGIVDAFEDKPIGVGKLMSLIEEHRKYA